MIQARPTFSESWYRVAALRPRLRCGAQISRQFHRGERWYVVRDPAGNQYHRLSDPAYCFVGLLDGRRTIEEAWDLVGGHLADDAPTQPEVIQILSQLYAANLLETNVPPDALTLLRRHKDQVKRKMQGRLMNVLFPRIPIWDPDTFLKRWMPLAELVFSWLGVIVWLAVVIFAAATLAPRWNDGPGSLKASASDAINPSNWLYLWAVFICIKAIHELGHAFACRRFGGECHELGLMLLVFVPTPYVDASSAWAFPSRWKRIFVGAAGMIVEIFVAAICSILWRNINETAYPLLHQLLYNAMFIASVSTVMFNANPLLRYDGYYILSDLLEIPNLRQKSSDYTLGLVKQHIFKIKPTQPLPPPGQRVWLALYSVLSAIYRLFIGLAIVVLVTFRVPILGVLMAIGGIITWAGVPVYKTVRYLTLDPELHRKRTRASIFCAAAAAAVILLIGVIPFRVYVQAVGFLEPNQRFVLTAPYDGFVRRIVAHDGQWLHKGDVILVADNMRLDAEIRKFQAELAESQAQQRLADSKNDMLEYTTAVEDAKALGEQLDSDIKYQDSLTIRAPIDGQLVAPDLAQLQGSFLANGKTEIGMVATLNDLRVKAILDSNDAELPFQAADLSKVENQVRFVSDLGTVLHARNVKPFPGAVGEVNPSFGPAGGGDLDMDPKDPKASHPKVPQFLIEMSVDNPGNKYIAGQRAYVRFTLERRPLIWQWMRRFWQIIQVHDSGKWI